MYKIKKIHRVKDITSFKKSFDVELSPGLVLSQIREATCLLALEDNLMIMCITFT